MGTVWTLVGPRPGRLVGGPCMGDHSGWGQEEGFRKVWSPEEGPEGSGALSGTGRVTGGPWPGWSGVGWPSGAGGSHADRAAVATPHPGCLPSPVQTMGIRTALPAAELGIYSLVLSGALAFAARGLLEASQGDSGAQGQGWDPIPWSTGLASCVSPGVQPRDTEVQRP